MSETSTLSKSPAAAAGTRHEQLQLVSFAIGEEQFAVNILLVQEINRMLAITRVPQSPECVEGVVNLRGRIIPVIDLRTRFGMASKAHDTESRIIVVEVRGKTLGFVVDKVHEVLRIDSSIVEPTPAMVGSVSAEYLEGVGKLEDRLLILLNLEKLFDAQQLQKITQAASAAA